jgi:hypothetical protein
MVDRVYKEALPSLRESLQELKEDFTDLGPLKTDWTKLRIDPLLKHVESLERLLHSAEFSTESSRLGKGVGMFHSDLVYLRLNVKELEKLLLSERRRLKK